MDLPFNDEATQALFIAASEAKRYNQEPTLALSLLLALWKCDDFRRRYRLGQSITRSSITWSIKKLWGPGSDAKPALSVNEVLQLAQKRAKESGETEISLERLAMTLLQEPEICEILGYGWKHAIQKEPSHELDALFDRFAEKKEDTTMTSSRFVPRRQWIPKELPDQSVLKQFGKDLTVAAKIGKLDPVIGREAEIQQATRILCRRTKKNPVLVGPPGVGKTAIAEGVAMLIASAQAPTRLLKKRVYLLEMSTLVAGTTYRGDFEERLKKVIAEAMEHDVILFIDELHTVIGSGSSNETTLDGAQILKPALARGELSVIGATTIEEYTLYIEKDAAFERRFRPVIVDEPSVEDSIEILKGLREKYEIHHGVNYTDAALEAAVTLSHRYINDRFLPDKAIDLIDEAGSMISAKESYVDYEICQVDIADIAAVVSKVTGIPVDSLTKGDRERLRNLATILGARVIGQSSAVTKVARVVRRMRTGRNDKNGPAGSALFLGRTGVGKTELAKALDEVVFDGRGMVRVDMSEYQEKHNVARLIGPPPGYVGYESRGQLTEAVRRNPYCVVLFDEIEKAHPDVFDVLLQVLDDGRLTDGQGRTVDFRNTIIILTSNCGVAEMKKGAIGFGENDDTDENGVPRRVMRAIETRFKPEFLGRIGVTVLFNDLTDDALRQIVDAQLQQLIEDEAARQITVNISETARKLLAKKGYNEKFGARPLKRVLQELVVDALVDLDLDREDGIPEGSKVNFDVVGDKLVTEVVCEKARIRVPA